MIEPVDEAISKFINGLKLKSELDIIVQLIFKFNLASYLERVSESLGSVGAISCSIAYIDKRPIVDFDFDQYRPGVEVGDLLVLVKKRCHLVNKNAESPNNPRSSAVFIQAKKSNERKIVLGSNQEKKQLQLYKSWPSFQLKRPKKLGRFTNTTAIDFKVSRGDSNPGIFMRVSDSEEPDLFSTSDLAKPISIKSFLNKIFSANAGKNFNSSDQFSLFVQDLYQDSQANTFIRKSIFPVPQSRVLALYTQRGFNLLAQRKSFSKYVGTSLGFIGLVNKLKAILNLVLRKKMLWVISIDIIHYD